MKHDVDCPYRKELSYRVSKNNQQSGVTSKKLDLGDSWIIETWVIGHQTNVYWCNLVGCAIPGSEDFRAQLTHGVRFYKDKHTEQERTPDLINVKYGLGY